MPKYLDEPGLTRFYDNISDRPVYAFDTVAEMQAATYLEDGMTCHTNGFHAADDGGAAYYTVSTSGTANSMDVLALQDGLKAALVAKVPSVEMLGAKSDGTTDSAAIFNYAIQHYDNFNAKGNYAIASPIVFSKNNTTYRIDGNIAYTGNDAAIDLSGINGSLFVNWLYAPNATAIRLAKYGHCNSYRIEFDSIAASINGIEFTSDTYRCQYNTIQGGSIAASNHGLHVELTSSGTNWYNSNHLYDVTFVGQSEYAIYLAADADIINCNSFKGYSAENTKRGAYLNNVRLAVFSEFRGIDNSSSKVEFSLNGDTEKCEIHANNFIYLGNIENNCTKQMANNILCGQIGINSGTPIFNKVIISAPVSYVSDASGFMPVEYSNAAKGLLWVSADTSLTPFTVPWQARKYLFISTNNITIELPEQWFNGRAINDIYFVSSGASKTFNVTYNGTAHTGLTTPLHLRIVTNDAGTSKDSFMY